MLLKINGIDKEVKLGFTSTEYNCSVKLVGRLVLQIEDKPIYVEETLHNQLIDATVRDTLIRELGVSMVSRHTYPSLRTTSPYFPNDNGVYLPNYLIYADSINLDSSAAWYVNFKSLIRELQKNPKHGFQVFEMPMYTNNTYGGSFWPSKVWGIVPPNMVDRLLTAEHFARNSSPRDGFDRLMNSPSKSSYPKEDLAYVKKILST